jgi:hypothetical protein
MALLEIPTEAQAHAFRSTDPAWGALVEYARRGLTVANKLAGQAPPADPILEMDARDLVREVEGAWLISMADTE